MIDVEKLDKYVTQLRDAISGITEILKTPKKDVKEVRSRVAWCSPNPLDYNGTIDIVPWHTHGRTKVVITEAFN